MPAAPTPLAKLRSVDLEHPNLAFTDGTYSYVTSGKPLGAGGMGTAFTVLRRPVGQPSAKPDTVVAKTFRPEVLMAMREDATARRHFEHNVKVLDRLHEIRHPNVLPVLLSAPIADNHLFITPLAGGSLFALLASGMFSPRDRVRLLIESLRGLAALHERGIVHRDFTLHNVLTLVEPGAPREAPRAVVFDFDLSVAPDLIAADVRSYQAHYQGRVAGSPEFSVAPELLDDVLGAEPISPRIDIYAVGTALFGVFTDESLYGDIPDLSTLLFRISDGIVRRGESRVTFPKDVPAALRPIIETCLEREPSARYADASAVLRAVKDASSQLSAKKAHGRFKMTMGYVHTEKEVRQRAVFTERLDPSVSRDEILKADETLGRHGYVIEKSLGRVKGHAIYLAAPDPTLVATGRFPEQNTYRKIVTVIELANRRDGVDYVEAWLCRIKPIVDKVRQGFLTSLHKALHDKPSDQLLLFTESVADPRFGTQLEKHELGLDEVFGLGYLLALPIKKLHAEGLAHNNIRLPSVLFKGVKESGRVQSLLVGLVEPSFDPVARDEDVRNLAGLIVGLIRQPRIDALHPDVRPAVELLRDALTRTAENETPTPSIGAFIDVIANGLCIIEPNFDILRVYGGDLQAYANLLVQHPLYNRLFAAAP